ncbi:hypothetical protein [Acidithiobacillus caldus]|jgi:hypothetical protein|uniref:hypothetical protein n=1 Tax=Acidithiobacillus caldus TaxID=33059 RepID=UPI001C06F891|nr:hypothetical protein [Acidithiobacillus caldus]MBU2764386.1 hypothetical protein [Acidithiobacillus caldus]MBU2769822.1 hypothetical protein [Acidithiobacillus caldus]WMT47752.1 MAG: hypothetical protein RE468_03825 [Acidithiobacillus caldus]
MKDPILSKASRAELLLMSAAALRAITPADWFWRVIWSEDEDVYRLNSHMLVTRAVSLARGMLAEIDRRTSDDD